MKKSAQTNIRRTRTDTADIEEKSTTMDPKVESKKYKNYKLF